MADFSLHSHGTSFAQWFFRKVYTDQEGWQEGKDILALATALPKLRQQGLERGNQVKCLSIQKSALSCSSLHLSFTLGQDFPQTPMVCVAAVEGTRTRDTASGAHRGGGTRDFVGASLMPVCITLLMLPFE